MEHAMVVVSPAAKECRQQWGYGTCYGGIVSPLRRSVETHVEVLKVMSVPSYDLEMHFNFIKDV